MAIQAGLRSILKNGTLVAGSTWFEVLIRLVYIVMVTQYLGPDGYGLWNYSITLYGLFFGFLAFGFEAIVYYSYGQSDEHGDRIVKTALGLRLIAGIVAIPVFLSFIAVAAPEQSAAGLVFLTPIFLGRGFAELVRSVYIARQNVQRNFTNVMFFRLSEVTVGILFLVQGAGVEALLILHMLSYVGESICGLFLLRKDYGLGIAGPGLSASKSLLRRSAPLAAIGIANAYVFSAPVILYGWIVSDFTQLGQLGIALQVAMILLTGTDFFLLAAIPVVSHGDARGDTRLRYYGLLLATIVVLIFGPLSMIMHYLAPPLFESVLGPQYALAAQLTVPATGLAALYLLPVGFLQIMVIRNRYIQSLIPSMIAAIVITLGMLIYGDSLDPTTVIWIACIAWASRAVAAIVFALLERRHQY